jgi:aspartyl-tRNA(Asn)/glutamyl-tRNA(Gln) amidotransferase subunit C
MAISRNDVQRVALLARLELSDAELDALTPQLAEVVAYVDQLGEVDTEGVEPMAHGVELTNVLRPDELAESLPREAVLASAPRHDNIGFRVPAVLGD